MFRKKVNNNHLLFFLHAFNTLYVLKRKRKKVREEYIKWAKEYGKTFIFYPDSYSNAIVNWYVTGSLIYYDGMTGKTTSFLDQIPLKIIAQGIEEIKNKITEGV